MRRQKEKNSARGQRLEAGKTKVSLKDFFLRTSLTKRERQNEREVQRETEVKLCTS